MGEGDFTNSNSVRYVYEVLILYMLHLKVVYSVAICTRIKNIKNVTRCRDSRSAKSIETR